MKTESIEVALKVTYTYDESRTPSLSKGLRENIALSLAATPNLNTIEEGVAVKSVEIVKADETILKAYKE